MWCQRRCQRPPVLAVAGRERGSQVFEKTTPSAQGRLAGHSGVDRSLKLRDVARDVAKRSMQACKSRLREIS